MHPTHPRIGWIGLGDQGAPMARAVAEARLGLSVAALVDAIRAGTGSSVALQSLGRAITTANAEHLSRLQLVDMDIFRRAVASLGDEVRPLTGRAVAGAEALPRLAQLVTG